MLFVFAVTVLGVFGLQSFLVCTLLFIKSRNVSSNRLLAALLLSLTLSYFNYFLSTMLALLGWDWLVPYLQIETLFGIGPALYLYTKSITSESFRFRGKDLLHFIPFVFEFLFYRTTVYGGGAIPLGKLPTTTSQYAYLIEQYAGMASISVYTFFSIRMLQTYKNNLTKFYSTLDHHSIRWLLLPVVGFGIFWLFWLGIRLIDILILSESLRQYYYLPVLILLAVISGWIGLVGYFKTDVLIRSLEARTTALSKEAERKVSAKKMGEVRQKVEENKLYLDTELTLASLAEKIGIHPKELSQVINQGSGGNFYDFVNQYRVLEFQNRIKQEGSEKLSLLGHAFESGFASKSTFNHIFKKTTGLTPRQYEAKYNQDNRH